VRLESDINLEKLSSVSKNAALSNKNNADVTNETNIVQTNGIDPKWETCSLSVIKDKQSSIKLFDETGNSDNIRVPIVKLIVNNNEIDSFLDTGSNVTLIKISAINEKAKITPTNVSAVSASGDEIAIKGETELIVKLPNGKNVNLKALVVEDNSSFPCKILIGTDLLVKSKAIIDFRKNEVVFTLKGIVTNKGIVNSNDNNDAQCPMLDAPSAQYAKADMPSNRNTCERDAHMNVDFKDMPAEHATAACSNAAKINNNVVCNLPKRAMFLHINEDTVIPACCNVSMTIKCRKIPDGTYCIEKNSVDGILVASALVNVKDGNCPIMLLNLTKGNITLTANQILSSIEKISTQNLRVRTLMSRDERFKTEPHSERVKNQIEHRAVTVADVNTPVEGDKLRMLINMLNCHRDAIALKGESLGHTHLITHDIKLKDEHKNDVVYIKQYKIAHSHQSKLDDAIDEMLKDGIIEETNSPWNSPIILVKKKTGDWRPVVDFRKLNSITEPARFPIPEITSLINSLRGSTTFSSLDMVSAFWQVSLSEEASRKTAFSTGKGHFQFKRLPFGLIDSPCVFQSLMNAALNSLLGVSALVYLDDIIIYSKNENEHLGHIVAALKKIRDAGLKIKLQKSEFFKKEIKFLGHVISGDGVKVDDGKFECIKNYPVPKNADDVRRFLGFIGFYRRFIRQFAAISTPLTELLKKNASFKWSENEQKAFELLKEHLLKKPVLQYPNFSQPFVIVTDASNHALGAALMQKHDKMLLPISFASKVLSKTERNYSTTKKEALAVIFALKKFRYIP